MEGDLPNGASSIYRKYTRGGSIEVARVCLTARSTQSSLSIVDNVHVPFYKFDRNLKRFVLVQIPSHPCQNSRVTIVGITLQVIINSSVGCTAVIPLMCVLKCVCMWPVSVTLVSKGNYTIASF